MCDLAIIFGCGVCACVVFTSVVYCLVGIILMVLAFRAQSALETYDLLVKEYDMKLFPQLGIAMGFFFTFLLVFGFLTQKCGRKTRLVYMIVQIALLLIGIYAFGWSYPNETEALTRIQSGLNVTLLMYGRNYQNPNQNVPAWDAMQQDLECCGVQNYLDWENVIFEYPHAPVPISCCKEEHRMTGCANHVQFNNPAQAAQAIHTQGCLPKVQSLVLGRMKLLYLCMMIILVITLSGITATCCSSPISKKPSDDIKEQKFGPLVIRSRTVSLKKKGKKGENPEAGEETKEEQTNEDETKIPLTSTDSGDTKVPEETTVTEEPEKKGDEKV